MKQLHNAQDAIEQASTAGWYRPTTETVMLDEIEHAMLHPNFWQALGKARGWYGSTCGRCGYNGGPNTLQSCDDCGAFNMHRATSEHFAVRWFETRLSNGDETTFWQNLP